MTIDERYELIYQSLYNTTFKGRDEYLTFRQVWRDTYSDIAAAIRVLTIARKESSRAIASCHLPSEDQQAIIDHAEKITREMKCSFRESAHIKLRDYASAMLRMRRESKQEAARQYSLAHPVIT